MKDFVVEEEENDDDDDTDNTEHMKSENQPHQKQPNPSNSELLAHYIPQCKIKISDNSSCKTSSWYYNKHQWAKYKCLGVGYDILKQIPKRFQFIMKAF